MKKEIIKIIQKEILWHRKHKTYPTSKKEEEGFISGLQHSIYLIKKTTLKD